MLERDMTNAKPARHYLKTPEQKWLWLGGMAACVLPALCGLILIIIMYFNPMDLEDQRNIDSTYLVFFSIPLIGAIIAAYLAIREIRTKNQFGFKGKSSFVWIAIKAGFVAHFIIAGLIFLLMLTLGGTSIFSNSIYLLVKLIIMGGAYTFIFWVFVTLPISAVSGLIFWFVAVRGGENMLADVFD